MAPFLDIRSWAAPLSMQFSGMHACGAVFQSNRSQAIRLPKAGAFPDDVKRVDIVAVGRTRIIALAGEIWGSWFEGAETTSDFMIERERAAWQEREYMLDQESISE